MLADDILAAAGGPRDRELHGSLSWLAARIQKAHRIVLSEEVTRSAVAVAALPMEQQLKALTLCRFPFPLTWLEWSRAASGLKGGREGALVDVDPDSLQHGDITVAWDNNVSPIMLRFDWRAGIAPFYRADIRAMSDTQIRDKIGDQVSTRAAMIEEQEREKFELNLDMVALFEALGRASNAKEYLDVAVECLHGQSGFIRAALLLINTKNLTTSEPYVASSKLQRARQRSGKAPILDYTKVTIKLSKALAARAGDAADPKNPMRLHLVRGHFKIRKSGVFWWSPFQRGSAAHGVIARQDRHVSRLTDTQDATKRPFA
jgi:hypothetical protein